MGLNTTAMQTAQESITVFALIIVLAPLGAALLGLFLKRWTDWLNWATPVFSGISFLATLWLIPKIQEQAVTIRVLPYLNFYLDALSIYFVLLVNLVALFTSFSIVPFLKADSRSNAYHNPARFTVYYNVFQATMLLVLLVENLVTMWIAVELTTVFSAVLIRYRRGRPSLEASWKFMMITTTGVIFALLGTLFMANAVPSGQLLSPAQRDWMSWAFLADRGVAAQLNPSFVMLSFLFILLGYGAKAGLAPMHTWLPDSHGEAPAPVSALLSGVMMNSALYAILRFTTITNLCLSGNRPQFTSPLLLAVGAFSVILAAPFIIKRSRFKRVLGYQSLAQMGMITFAIGVGTPVALFGALLLALNHALTKALMFLIYGSIQYEYQERCGEAPSRIDEDIHIQGILKALPLSGTILAFGGLALAGSPPFSIFMSQFMIIWAALREVIAKNNLILAVGLLCVVISATAAFAGLVRHLARLLLGPAPFAPVKLTSSHWRVLAPLLILLTGMILFGFLLPSQPVNLPQVLERSVTIIQNGVSLVNISGVP